MALRLIKSSMYPKCVIKICGEKHAFKTKYILGCKVWPHLHLVPHYFTCWARNPGWELLLWACSLGAAFLLVSLPAVKREIRTLRTVPPLWFCSAYPVSSEPRGNFCHVPSFPPEIGPAAPGPVLLRGWGAEPGGDGAGQLGRQEGPPEMHPPGQPVPLLSGETTQSNVKFAGTNGKDLPVSQHTYCNKHFGCTPAILVYR